MVHSWHHQMWTGSMHLLCSRESRIDLGRFLLLFIPLLSLRVLPNSWYLSSNKQRNRRMRPRSECITSFHILSSRIQSHDPTCLQVRLGDEALLVLHIVLFLLQLSRITTVCQQLLGTPKIISSVICLKPNSHIRQVPTLNGFSGIVSV